MRSSVRDMVPAAFLTCCILFGGASAAGHVAGAALQWAAIVILCDIALVRTMSLTRPAWMVMAAFAGFGIWLLMQLVPLPPMMWTALPGRAVVTHGFALMGVVPGWEPLSLTPDATVSALLALLPPAAMASLTLVATQRARTIAIGALIAVAIGAAVLGAAQVLAGADSALYPYRITNPGKAVGPFANRNHLATLLLCALPFIGMRIERRGVRRSGAAFAGMAIVAGGVALTGSDAGLALLAIVLVVGAATIAVRRGVRRATWLRWIAGAALLLTAGARVAPDGGAGAEERRGVTVPRTLAAALDHLPFGAGGGSFPTIYPAYTDPALASPAFVNHAHSDYAELLLDHGIVGILLIGGTWWWWTRRVVAGWQGDPVVRAGLVAVGVVLLHSLVDYPLRTTAIAAVAAFAAALATGQPPGRSTVRRSRNAARELSATFDLR